VQDGPFKNMTVNIGPGFTSQPRCVNRLITNSFSSLVNQTYVDIAVAPSTYDEAWISIYNGPHLGGHIALAMMVGG
jgi:tyrosinase